MPAIFCIEESVGHYYLVLAIANGFRNTHVAIAITVFAALPYPTRRLVATVLNHVSKGMISANVATYVSFWHSLDPAKPTPRAICYRRSLSTSTHTKRRRVWGGKRVNLTAADGVTMHETARHPAYIASRRATPGSECSLFAAPAPARAERYKSVNFPPILILLFCCRIVRKCDRLVHDALLVGVHSPGVRTSPDFFYACNYTSIER